MSPLSSEIFSMMKEPFHKYLLQLIAFAFKKKLGKIQLYFYTLLIIWSLILYENCKV